MLIETNGSAFNDNLEGTCIVDFYGVACPACVAYTPIFAQVAQEYEDLKFLKVNIDNNLALAQIYGVEYIPTTIKFVDGKPTSKAVGCIEAEQLRSLADS